MVSSGRRGSAYEKPTLWYTKTGTSNETGLARSSRLPGTSPRYEPRVPTGDGEMLASGSRYAPYRKHPKTRRGEPLLRVVTPIWLLPSPPSRALPFALIHRQLRCGAANSDAPGPCGYRSRKCAGHQVENRNN